MVDRRDRTFRLILRDREEHVLVRASKCFASKNTDATGSLVLVNESGTGPSGQVTVGLAPAGAWSAWFEETAVVGVEHAAAPLPSGAVDDLQWLLALPLPPKIRAAVRDHLKV
jgi:hypothetical protein